MHSQFLNLLIGHYPTMVLSLLVIIGCIRKGVESVNIFFITAAVITILQSVFLIWLWSKPSPYDDIRHHIKWQVIFAPGSPLFMYGILKLILQNRGELNADEPLWKVILATLFTVGLYTPYWYIKKYHAFNRSNWLVVLYVAIAFISLYINSYVIADPTSFTFHTRLVANIALAIVVIVMIFHLRAVLLDRDPYLDVNPVLTILFGIFYLQYCINRMQPASHEDSLDRTVSV